MTVGRRSAYYFVAAAASAATSFVLLPLTTRILGPEDYGLFALLVAYVTVGSALSTLGTSYLVFNRLPDLEAEERARLLTSCVAVALMLGSFITASVAVLLLNAGHLIGLPTPVPVDLVGLTLVSMVLSPLWVVASDLLTLEGRARGYAATVIAQSGAIAAATLVSLFVFEAGVASLFIGYLAGMVVVAGASVRVLVPYLTRVDRRWLREQAAMAGNFVAAHATETGYIVLERSLLSVSSGVAALGLYTHAQRYRDVANLGAKSVTRGVWPVTLDEARSGAGFPVTGRTWAVAHLAVTALGIVFAGLGDRIIALLTHDRFTAAAVYVPFFLAILLVQNLAKPQHGSVWALAPGRTVANLNLVTNVMGLIALAVLVPFFGPVGALGAVGAQALTYRMAVHRLSRRYRTTPFQDTWAVRGIVAILCVTGLARIPGTGLAVDVAIVTAALAVVVLVGRDVIADGLRAVAALRATLRSSPSQARP